MVENENPFLLSALADAITLYPDEALAPECPPLAALGRIRFDAGPQFNGAGRFLLCDFLC